jgi:hypothetical protein
MKLYIPASDVRRGDILRKRYADLPIFETYENRRGHVCLCVTAPWGEHEFHHRPTTKVLIERPTPTDGRH